jgi:hypothetical protein
MLKLKTYYVAKRNEFKKHLQNAMKTMRKERRENLIASSNDPKRFWETLKRAKPIIKSVTNYINRIEWFAYVSNLFATQDSADTLRTPTHHPSIILLRREMRVI